MNATEGGSSNNGTENLLPKTYLRDSLPEKGMLCARDTVYTSTIHRMGGLEKTFRSESKNVPSAQGAMKAKP
jgi:hypothetical protein